MTVVLIKLEKHLFRHQTISKSIVVQAIILLDRQDGHC